MLRLEHMDLLKFLKKMAESEEDEFEVTNVFEFKTKVNDKD